jgi:hypothetical protein
MDEGGRLERVTDLLAVQGELGLTPQLGVDEPNERVARLGLPRTPRPQRLGHGVSVHPRR